MYTQGNEEEVILKLVDEMGLSGSNNAFLDIGAADGVTFSNTRALADRGWRGTLVEPNPSGFVGLMRNYSDPVKWPADRYCLINALAVPNEQTVGASFLKFHSSADLVSSTDEGHVAKWRSVAQFQQIWLPPCSLRRILHGHNAFHLNASIGLLSIDTEATSKDLLMAFPFLIYPVAIVVVEHDEHGDAIRDYMAGQGFNLVHTTAQNQIYRRV